MVLLSGDQFKATTPRTFIYPGMKNTQEKDNWINSSYSDLVRIIYSIIERAISSKRPTFDKPTKANESLLFKIPPLPSKKPNKKKGQLITLQKVDTKVYESHHIKLSSLIIRENHRIETMFTFYPDSEKLLKPVFARMAEMLDKRKFPCELVSEKSKRSFIENLIDEVVKFFKDLFKLKHPRDLEIETGIKLIPENGTLLDFAVTRTLRGETRRFIFCVVEANRELPRHSIPKCLDFIKRMKELDPGQKVWKTLNGKLLGLKF